MSTLTQTTTHFEDATGKFSPVSIVVVTLLRVSHPSRHHEEKSWRNKVGMWQSQSGRSDQSEGSKHEKKFEAGADMSCTNNVPRGDVLLGMLHYGLHIVTPLLSSDQVTLPYKSAPLYTLVAACCSAPVRNFWLCPSQAQPHLGGHDTVTTPGLR